MKKKKKELCEACKKFEFSYTITPENSIFPPYKLCANCMTNLVMLSLAPHEYLNLVAQHPDRQVEFWLHDDFYDPKSGYAFQPMHGEPIEPVCPLCKNTGTVETKHKGANGRTFTAEGPCRCQIE